MTLIAVSAECPERLSSFVTEMKQNKTTEEKNYEQRKK